MDVGSIWKFAENFQIKNAHKDLEVCWPGPQTISKVIIKVSLPPGWRRVRVYGHGDNDDDDDDVNMRVLVPEKEYWRYCFFPLLTPPPWMAGESSSSSEQLGNNLLLSLPLMWAMPKRKHFSSGLMWVGVRTNITSSKQENQGLRYNSPPSRN